MIDIHAHIYDEQYTIPVEQIVEEARLAGVEKIVCSASSISASKKAIALAEKFDNVYATIGVHPEDAEKFDNEAEKWLEENAHHPKVVAIGEIGLDFHYHPHDKELQKKVFIHQLELAHRVGLPIQIHSRDATGATIEILEKYRHLLTHGGIVHCYSGSVETLLHHIIPLGLSISIGGIVTFKNARETLDVTIAVPPENLLIETDCPYLTPVPHRGETNFPKFAPLSLHKIAVIKGILASDLEKITNQNALRIFPKLKN